MAVQEKRKGMSPKCTNTCVQFALFPKGGMFSKINMKAIVIIVI